ncbi:uncharacterized protein [Hetaerina americana]|uniref:uncharacterized protein isoform X1 n=1 Tax=Hetaerina americana TaxID=62018 RepID=UPI003A7F3C1D
MPGNADSMGTAVLALVCLVIGSGSGQLLAKEHKTHAASGKPNDLGCFVCDTMEDGDKCASVNQSDTLWRSKCNDDRRMCMVKRFSYTTSTENSTSEIRMWYLERNCTHRCEPGCIVIGERTKLYACTACCEKPYCNWMSRAGGVRVPFHPILAPMLPVITAIAYSLPS